MKTFRSPAMANSLCSGNSCENMVGRIQFMSAVRRWCRQSDSMTHLIKDFIGLKFDWANGRGKAKAFLWTPSSVHFMAACLPFSVVRVHELTWHIIALQSVKWEICEYLMPLQLCLFNLFFFFLGYAVPLLGSVSPKNINSVSELSVLQIWMLC